MPSDALPTSVESSSLRATRLVHLSLGVVVVLAVVGSIAAWLRRVSLILDYPYQLDYMEGSALNWAAWSFQGLPLYPTIGDGPFIHHAYMPLFVGFITLLGDLNHIALPILRWIGIGPTILIGLILMMLARKHTGGWFWSLVAIGVWFSWPAVYVYGSLVRPEPLGVLFCTAGFLRLRASPTGVLEATLWFGLAILCKQPFLFTAIVAGGWFLLTRPKFGLAFAGTMAVFGGVMLLTAYLATGPNFWWHTVTVQNNAWDLSLIVQWASFNTMHLSVPIVLALFACWSHRKSPSLSPWIAYFFGAWLTTITVAKVGSALHYFIEVGVPTTFLAVVGARDLMRLRPARLALVGCVCLVATIVPLWHWPGRWPIYHADFTPTTVARQERDAAAAWIAAHPGKVIIYDMDIAVRGGQRSWLQPWMYATLFTEQTWDDAPLVRQAMNGDFSAVLLPFPLNMHRQLPATSIMFTDSFLDALTASYEPAAIIPYASGRPWLYCYTPRAARG